MQPPKRNRMIVTRKMHGAKGSPPISQIVQSYPCRNCWTRASARRRNSGLRAIQPVSHESSWSAVGSVIGHLRTTRDIDRGYIVEVERPVPRVLAKPNARTIGGSGLYSKFPTFIICFN